MSNVQAMEIIEAHFRMWQRISGGSDLDIHGDCWNALMCYRKITEAEQVRLEYEDICV